MLHVSRCAWADRIGDFRLLAPAELVHGMSSSDEPANKQTSCPPRSIWTANIAQDQGSVARIIVSSHGSYGEDHEQRSPMLVGGSRGAHSDALWRNSGRRSGS